MSESKPFRWALWLPLGLLLGFLGIAMWALTTPKVNDVASAMIGKPLPEFELRPAIAERPGLARKDYAGGKPRLLNIFASWCIPCAVEAPQLDQLARQGIQIDGIAIRDRREDVQAFLARNGNPFARIGADDVSAVQLALGSSGVPETFVIDGQGTIRYQHIGEIRPEHVPLILEKLKEAGL